MLMPPIHFFLINIQTMLNYHKFKVLFTLVQWPTAILKTCQQGRLNLQVKTARHIVTNGVHYVQRTMCSFQPCLYLQNPPKFQKTWIINNHLSRS